MVTGVSSPPSITNLRGRMLAATRTPLTASASAPGRTVLIARMVARSGEKSAALRRSETSASVTSKDTQFSLSAVPRCRHPRKRMIQYSLVSRFRSSQDLAAHSRANFGIKGTLEPISKSSEEENKAGELDESKEVLSVVFPADENAALPLDPRKEAFYEPAAHVAG